MTTPFRNGVDNSCIRFHKKPLRRSEGFDGASAPNQILTDHRKLFCNLMSLLSTPLAASAAKKISRKSYNNDPSQKIGANFAPATGVKAVNSAASQRPTFALVMYAQPLSPEPMHAEQSICLPLNPVSLLLSAPSLQPIA